MNVIIALILSLLGIGSLICVIAIILLCIIGVFSTVKELKEYMR